VANVKDDPAITNPRPDIGGRNLTWSQAETQFSLTAQYWKLI